MTVATFPSVPNLVADYLQAKNDAEGEREIAGGATWRASKLGSCLKQQYLQLFLKQPVTQEIDATTLKKFEVGHIWGDIFKRWFDAMGLLVHEEYGLHSPTLNIGAHADFVIGKDDWRAGVELKSMQSRYFWYRKQEGGTVAAESHLIQAATYDILAREQGIEMPWLVVTVSKDDLTIHQDEVTEHHRHVALKRINLLNEAVISGTPPPCTCTDPEAEWGGRQWTWCPYYSGDQEADKEASYKHSKSRARDKGKFEVPSPCCEVHT